jgi:lysophospholipase L1-like esterase
MHIPRLRLERSYRQAMVDATILCYGDSNTWGCIPIEGDEAPRRLGSSERWPGILRAEMGESVHVVEEGLNSRTTVFDDPLEPGRNGRPFLSTCLLSHQPLDLVIVMLGTNDLKVRFGVSAGEVAEGAGLLVDDVLRSRCGPQGSAPQVLLVCPPPLGRLKTFADVFEGGVEKSRALPEHYAAVSARLGCEFLDAGTLIRSSDVDGIHLEADQHAVLGRAIAERARRLLA